MMVTKKKNGKVSIPSLTNIMAMTGPINDQINP